MVNPGIEVWPLLRNPPGEGQKTPPRGSRVDRPGIGPGSCNRMGLGCHLLPREGGGGGQVYRDIPAVPSKVWVSGTISAPLSL